MIDLSSRPFEIQQELQEIAEAHAEQTRWVPFSFCVYLLYGLLATGGLVWLSFSFVTNADLRLAVIVACCASLLLAVAGTVAQIVLKRLSRMEAHQITLHQRIFEQKVET